MFAALYLCDKALDMYNRAVVSALLQFNEVVCRLPAVAYSRKIGGIEILSFNAALFAGQNSLIPNGAADRNIVVRSKAEVLVNVIRPLVALRDAVAVNAEMKF